MRKIEPNSINRYKTFWENWKERGFDYAIEQKFNRIKRSTNYKSIQLTETPRDLIEKNLGVIRKNELKLEKRINSNNLQ